MVIMKKQLRSLARVLPALLLSTGCGRAADPVQCPPVIEVRQQLKTPVAGWSAGLDELPHRLAGITFFDGKPEEQASLAPDSEAKAGTRSVSTWNFGSGGRPVSLLCRYASTTVTLVRELPKSVRTCAVTYNPRQSIGGLPLIEKFDCK